MLTVYTSDDIYHAMVGSNSLSVKRLAPNMYPSFRCVWLSWTTGNCVGLKPGSVRCQTLFAGWKVFV